MNKERRKQLGGLIDDIEGVQSRLDADLSEDDRADISGSLDDIISNIESLRDEEQDYYDSMPESFQNGEKGDTAQNAISEMESAISEVEEARNCAEDQDNKEWHSEALPHLTEAVGNLSNAQG